MRHIQKKGQPQELIRWKDENRATPNNLIYGGGGFPYAETLKALIKEQRGLCAYTMIRITADSAHVEHLKPQTLCRREDADKVSQGKASLREDIHWDNMVACHPQPNAVRAKFGAHVKDDWWEPADFVSPLRADCEVRLRFSGDGTIAPASPHDKAAEVTIARLKLDHDTLNEKRKAAILAAGVHRLSKRPLSIEAAKRLAAKYAAHTGDQLPEFSVAIVHAAEEYVSWCEKLARQRKFSAAGA